MPTEPVPTEDFTGKAIVRFNPAEAEIVKLKAELQPLIADPDCCRSIEGLSTVKAVLKNTTQMRGQIEKARVKYKADALEYGRKVDAEARRLTGLVLEIESPLRTAKEAVEREAEERARKIVEEQERKEREEAARKLAEEEAKRRAEREREEAERQAERQRLAEERAKFEAERKAEEERRKAEREAFEREQAEEQRKLAEERRAVEAEAARVRAEREKVERAEFEKRAQEEADRRAKEDAERRMKEAQAAEERRQREAAELAKRRAAEEEERKRQEAAARPDIEKVHAFGDRIADLIAEANSAKLTTAKAREFIGQVRADLMEITDRCKAFGKPARRAVSA